MAETIRFLYGPDGLPVRAQMPYAEYARLEQEIAAGVSLKERLSRVAGVLSSDPGLSGAPAQEKAPPARPVEAVPAPAPVPPPPPVAPPPPAVPKPASGPSKKPAAASEAPVAAQIPLSLQTYVTEQDPSQQALRVIEACVRRIAAGVGRRITVSLHRPYICFWDFDVWRVFACGELRNGELYLSVDQTLLPDASDIWTPPSGVFKTPMARMRVDRVSDDLIEFLTNAVNSHEAASA